MTPHVVVDVGNSRIKWGRCRPGAVTNQTPLPADEPVSWEQQLNAWALSGCLRWALAGVHPPRRDAFARWARERGDLVLVLDRWQMLPLEVCVPQPDRVGIDRLLDAVAANSRRLPHRPAIVIDAGSAVTVDLLDSGGRFRGGAILPGFRLMAQALHQHTALLPLVEQAVTVPAVPAGSTQTAMQAGIYWAVVGGVRAILDRLAPAPESIPGDLFVTGGAGPRLEASLRALPDDRVSTVRPWPEMTLEGIRLAAEHLP